MTLKRLPQGKCSYFSVFPSTNPSDCRSWKSAFKIRRKPYRMFWRPVDFTALVYAFLPHHLSYAALSACIALSPLNGIYTQVKKCCISSHLFINSSFGQKTKICISISKICNPSFPSLRSESV